MMLGRWRHRAAGRRETPDPLFCLVPGTEVEGQEPCGREPQEFWQLVQAPTASQAELGYFGWLPPAYQPVTCWRKSCEAALALAAKKCEKGAGKTGGF